MIIARSTEKVLSVLFTQTETGVHGLRPCMFVKKKRNSKDHKPSLTREQPTGNTASSDEGFLILRFQELCVKLRT